MRGLMDRLVDAPLPEDGGRRVSVTDMRNSVSRDLENLLNTRSEGARLISDSFKECRASSLTYGILDFSSYSLLSPHDRDRIRRSLELAIGLHEGRLTRIRVTLEPQRELDRALRFRVDALMELGPDNEKVQFDAVLQLNTQTYVVR
ncbi:type VI secretion system baseplate subunit TssE [Thermomonas sp.]|jgi:type VI secretion system protein ImpF|uniref:type VI secretion system baseplate subunit TssE n=1 Tax=Thermomonas sp. TaxID=1971895 RepID=UPI002CDE6177|nr:type VI secretion system baseplate subunit TssE [Thermomonas sp.]HPW13149.1 type VI secretion system baseplate subunit TssE [Thermomonas sp.]